MKSLNLKQQAELLRILAHPTRLEILKELSSGAKCVTDIRDLLEISQPTCGGGSSRLRVGRCAMSPILVAIAKGSNPHQNHAPFPSPGLQSVVVSGLVWAHKNP